MVLAQRGHKVRRSRTVVNKFSTEWIFNNASLVAAVQQIGVSRPRKAIGSQLMLVLLSPEYVLGAFGTDFGMELDHAFFELVKTAFGTRVIDKELFKGLMVLMFWGRLNESVPSMLDSINAALKEKVEG